MRDSIAPPPQKKKIKYHLITNFLFLWIFSAKSGNRINPEKNPQIKKFTPPENIA